MHSNDGYGIQPHITFHFQQLALFLRFLAVFGRVCVYLCHERKTDREEHRRSEGCGGGGRASALCRIAACTMALCQESGIYRRDVQHLESRKGSSERKICDRGHTVQHGPDFRRRDEKISFPCRTGRQWHRRERRDRSQAGKAFRKGCTRQ